jgi:hypothetical protein
MVEDRFVGRDGLTFEALGYMPYGVAERGVQIATPRGMPSDASKDVAAEYASSVEMHNGYDPSWLTLAELEPNFARVPAMSDTICRMRSLAQPDDVRVVFWFGN